VLAMASFAIADFSYRFADALGGKIETKIV